MYEEKKQTYSCKCKPPWTGETCAELGKNNFEQYNAGGQVLSVKSNTTQNICRKTNRNKTELFKKEVK